MKTNPGRVLYVAFDGNDQNKGSKQEPFKSLAAARDAIREIKANSGLPKGGIHVVVMGGGYYLEDTFVLEAQDSGTTESPIVYRAADDAKVTVSTGTDIPTNLFRPIQGKERTYLKPEAQSKVIVAELKGHASANAFPQGQGDYGLLAWNQYTMQLAQWPNRGYNHLDKVIDMGPTLRWLTKGEKEAPYSFEKPIGGKFTMREKTDFAAWQRELARTQDVYQTGYLSIDWTKDNNRLARVSPEGTIQLLDSTNYGIGGVRYKGGFADPSHKPKFMSHRRLVFKNLLCELDMPGEWYFDRQDKKLYIWPITAEYQNARIAIPGGPLMVKMQDTENICLQGFIFENGGKLGLDMRGGANNTIAGCTFRNFYGRAARISGRNNGFKGCDFYNLEGAFSIGGGGP